MTGLNILQLRQYIIKPALKLLSEYKNKMDSEAAVNLLVGTALVESGLIYLRQHNNGPARGIYQIEPDTDDDIWYNFIGSRPKLGEIVSGLLAPEPLPNEQLVSNLLYATVIARLKYWRAPAALPAAEDIAELAAYWKKYYNTAAGAGKQEKFITTYEKHHN